MEPKVSIIIPIYNQENNLTTSIPAVISQNWSNLEIIAVNDGSTDKSEQIIDRYIEKDKRIVKINKKNGGLVDATLAGVKVASGDYICFMDPDDVIGPDFVSNFMHHIGENDVVAMGFFTNDGVLIRENKLLESRVYRSEMEINFLKDSFLYEKGQDGVSKRLFISRWNKLYKTSVVKQIIPEFEKVKNVSLGEDTIFTYLILNNISSLITKEEPNSYVYNINSTTSMMANGATDMHLKKSKIAYKEFLSIITKYHGKVELAYALYYYLCNSLIDRMRKNTNTELRKAYTCLHTDDIFKKGKRIVKPSKINERIKRVCWLLPSQSLYYRISNFLTMHLKQSVKL